MTQRISLSVHMACPAELSLLPEQGRSSSQLLLVTAAHLSKTILRMPLQEHCHEVNCAVSVPGRPADGAHVAGRSTLKAKLARSGHAANVIGLKVVITGGILRDGSLIVDVITVDLATMSVSR